MNARNPREVLRGYFGTHDAIRSDLNLIEGYLERPADKQAETFAAFRRWFDHHAAMLGHHHHGEDHFFFPRLQKKAGAEIGFMPEMGTQHEAILRLEQLIADDFANRTERSLAEHLRAYIDEVRQHLDDEEKVFVPFMMEHYTPDEFERLERAYARTFSLASIPVMLPWMISRMSASDRAAFLGGLPASLRFVYSRFWEPRYKQRFVF